VFDVATLDDLRGKKVKESFFFGDI
jgi:hypothetical protein